MADYIERQVVTSVLYEMDAVTMRGLEILNQFPAADVAPVRHGYWILEVESIRLIDDYDEEGFLKCSVCGRRVPCSYFPYINDSDWINELEDYPYCHCGAKMDG